MATTQDIGLKDYCDSVYCELTDMKSRLLKIVQDIEDKTGAERESLKHHIPHFHEIVNFIDWKLQILMKVCPFDWSGYKGEVEKTASVRIQEEHAEKEPVAGGYVGG